MKLKMLDPFLKLTRPLNGKRGAQVPVSSRIKGDTGDHKTRAHSKFSASGAERYAECPGSVELSEGLPDRSSRWSREGTQAHEVLEDIMRMVLGLPRTLISSDIPSEMLQYGKAAAKFIFGIRENHPGSEVQVETRIRLDFIHPEMFGTFDAGVIDHFGTLHVFDYKYGAGTFVSPKENLQMIFYGLGLAHLHHWNFKNIRLWIIQPRVRGYDGPLFWDMPILEARNFWVPKFRAIVERVEREPDTYVEGSWCHWCKAKSICPLKYQAKIEAAGAIFAIHAPYIRNEDE